MTEIAEAMESAVGHHQAGRLGQAEQTYQMILESEPNHPVALHSLGLIALQKGQYNASVELISRAIEAEPQIPQFHNNIGIALKGLGHLQEAISAYQKAISLKPDYAQAYNNMGAALYSLGQYAAAVENCKQAVSLKPDYAEAYNNMSVALQSQNQFPAAIENCKQAIATAPDYYEAYNTMATLLQMQGRHNEAIEYYRQTLRLKPDYAEVHNNLALALLLCGRFAEGWKEYEWRLHPKIAAYPHRYQTPRWDGSSFVGKRLLVHYEQGLGDSLQFVRYLPMAKARGGTVIFEARKPLIGLFRGFEGIDELVEAQPNTPPDVKFDYHIPLLSLPGIFATTLETIPADIPYLHADAAKAEAWRGQFSEADLKIGLVWAGRPAKMNDGLHLRYRCCEPENFKPLAKVKGVKFYGLQKGSAASESKKLAEILPITNLADQLEDFTDTAAVIENLDLVISVDTAVLHLAGMMGKEVWALLSFIPDWRWMLERTDSPWYPTVRLFRQKKWGDWDDVFRRLTEQLQRLISRNKNH